MTSTKSTKLTKLTPIEERLLAELAEETAKGQTEVSAKKRKRTNKSDKSHIQPPKKCSRHLPDVSVNHSSSSSSNSSNINTNNIENQNVLRFILNNLDQGKNIIDFLPVTKGEEIEHSSIKPEEFLDLDDETNKELESIYNKDIARKNEERLLEQERNENTAVEARPDSPGKEYDKLYLPAEIGVRKPRFKAKALQEIFKHDPSMKKSQMEKFMSSAKFTEKDIRIDYAKYKSPDLIANRMIAEMKKKKSTTT